VKARGSCRRRQVLSTTFMLRQNVADKRPGRAQRVCPSASSPGAAPARWPPTPAAGSNDGSASGGESYFSAGAGVKTRAVVTRKAGDMAVIQGGDVI